MPHLGGWEWAGVLAGRTGLPLTVVVEPLEPPELFEFFLDFRRSLGMNVVPLGPSRGRRGAPPSSEDGIVCLLCDRDIEGDGSRSSSSASAPRCPPGRRRWPLRTGARSCRPRSTSRRRPPRRSSGRRSTSSAGPAPRRRRPHHPGPGHALEELIRRRPRAVAPEQPNWPSDYEALEAIGKPDPRRTGGPAVACSVRIGMICPYSLTVPGGVQGQVLGVGPYPAGRVTTSGSSRPATGRRPTPGSPRSASCHGRQRLGGADRARRRPPSCGPSVPCATKPLTSCTCTSRLSGPDAYGG